jgi:hypothetical protein
MPPCDCSIALLPSSRMDPSLKKDKRILDTKPTRRAPVLQSCAEPAL